jgi:hypothetical protein
MSTDPVMRFEIRNAQNGWILEVETPPSEGGEANEVVCQERHEDAVECFADFLRVLNEEFGPSTSRYSPKRIFIRVEPGDKHE